MGNNAYLSLFIEESLEHLEVLNNQLVALEANPDEKEIIEEIFRAAHTIKGMAATMSFNDIAELTHILENVLDGIRSENISVNTHMIDVMFAALEHLQAMIADIADGGSGERDVQSVVKQLEMIEKGDTDTVNESSIGKVAMTTDKRQTQRIELDQFEQTVIEEAIGKGFNVFEIFIQLAEDCVLKGARAFMVFDVLSKLGEVVKADPSVEALEEEQFDSSFSVVFVSQQKAQDIQMYIEQISEITHVEMTPIMNQRTETAIDEQVATTAEMKEQPVKSNQTNDKHKQPQRLQHQRQTIRVNIDRLDALMNLFEELVIDRGRLEQIASELDHQGLKETVERMSRTSSDLQSVILNMRMVPVSHVFNRFPSMVRQLSRDLKKRVHLIINGAETELDRTVIDQIGDPLVHLLRNAVDHGIEAPEERQKQGKNPEGTIQLNAYHSGNDVFIEIKDDGAGINKEKVLKKAIDNHVILPNETETLTDQQVYDLIMESGFSTTDKVSDVSGRGVGLDVVKNTIEQLGGSVTITSEQGKGSTFLVKLPLTLSIMMALLVDIQQEIYAIPLTSIIETRIIHEEEIIDIHGREMLDFRGKVIPVVSMQKFFDIPIQSEKESPYLSVVIIKNGEHFIGLIVDSFIGQQEIVIKPLGNYLKDVPAISGATILGNGEVALIIDSHAIVKG